MTEEQLLNITGGRLASEDERLANIIRWHQEQAERQELEAVAKLRGCSVARVKWERRMAQKQLDRELRAGRRFKAINTDLKVALGELLGKLEGEGQER